MPYYGKVACEGYEMTAKPYCFIRRFVRYRLGRKINFKIIIRKTKQATRNFEKLEQAIYDHFPGYQKYDRRYGIEKEFMTNPTTIHYESETIIQEPGMSRVYIGSTYNSQRENVATVFSCDVLHPDDIRGWWWREIVLAIIVVIATFILTKMFGR